MTKLRLLNLRSPLILVQQLLQPLHLPPLLLRHLARCRRPKAPVRFLPEPQAQLLTSAFELLSAAEKVQSSAPDGNLSPGIGDVPDREGDLCISGQVAVLDTERDPLTPPAREESNGVKRLRPRQAG
jgi:hypothetical protein